MLERLGLKKSWMRQKSMLISGGVLFLAACGASDSSETTPQAPPLAVAGIEMPSEDTWLRAMPGDQFFSEPVEPASGSASYFAEVAGTDFSLVSLVQQQLMIRRASMVIETEVFDLVNRQIAEIVASFDGFIENSRRDLTTASYTLRVPVGHFTMANTHLQALGYVTSFSESSEDVSAQFTDLERRLNIRQEEERRLETMLDQTTSLNDILNLERRLSDLRLLIQHYQNRLTEIDQLASFSTITVTLIDISEDDATGYSSGGGFFNDLTDAFSSSVQATQTLLEGVAVFLAFIILPGLVFGGIGVVIWLLVRRRQGKEA